MESTTRERTAGEDGNQEVNQITLLSSKSLHRFVQKEPRSLGIVIAIFGCAELLMGFHLASDTAITSFKIYIPFWQGVLFLVCGSLSIYTEVHPSKRMVTVCLAMYVMSLIGIIVSVCFRIYCIAYLSYNSFSWGLLSDKEWYVHRSEQLLGVESLLFTSSLCVSVLLIFLCVITGLALTSTRTQVIVKHILPPPNDTTSN